MATQVEAAEATAKRALVRLATSVEAGVAFAFSPDECRDISNLIDVLRDHQAVDAQSNPFERPCSVCRGQGADDDDPCDGCDNLGMSPTRAGRQILDLIDRHYFTSTDDDAWVADPEARQPTEIDSAMRRAVC